MAITKPRTTQGRTGLLVAVGSLSVMLAAPLTPGTAAATTTSTERPILTANDVRPGVIALHAMTDPALTHATVYFYKIVHGEKRVVGYESTGPAGRAHVRLHVRPGSVHRYVAKWRHIRNGMFKATNPQVPTKSRYSNVIKYRAAS